MDKLRDFLNAMPVHDQHSFADRCGTTLGYMRKAISVGARFDASICIAIESESHGSVRCEDLRPDVPWSILREQAAPAEKVAA